MAIFLRLHNMVKCTKVLGPGNRAALWVQGCKRSCKGCMSPKTRSFEGGYLIEIDKIFDEVAVLKNIEGITISGGEPFLQSKALNALLKRIRTETNLGVIIYTGYTVEELRNIKDEHINEILDGLADLIIDGEYVEELNDGKAFKGSSNQRLVHITDRYVEYESLYQEEKRNVEIYASINELFFVGIPEEKMLKEWKNIAQEFVNKVSKRSY